MRRNSKNFGKNLSVLTLCFVLGVGVLYTGGCGVDLHADDAVLQKEMNAAEEPDLSADSEMTGQETDGVSSGEEYRSPELQEYNQTAVDHILQVGSKGDQFGQTDWPELEDLSAIGEVEPYQLIVGNPGEKSLNCQSLLEFYFDSYQPEQLSAYGVTGISQSYGSKTEILGYVQIAGDDWDYVAILNFKRTVFGDESQQFQEKLDTWGKLCHTDDSNYPQLYGSAAVHIKMSRDYVCELADIADTDTVLAAFAQADPDHAADYENALIPVIPKTADTGRFRVSDGRLQVTYDGGDAWTDVPLSTELLFERGDQRDGALSQVQDGSYTVSEDLAAIAYGGSTSTPVSVIFSTDQGKNWKKVTVPAKTTSVRQLFLCRAGQGSTLYLIATSDRSMSVEGEYLFRSDDGGASWKLVSSQYEGNPYHFTDTDASFTDENTGFLCIKNSQYPTMLYTADGGQNWRQAQFEQLPQGYTMAYAPSVCEEGLELYVGMDGYQKESGSVWRMVSADGGATWTADREYYFG